MSNERRLPFLDTFRGIAILAVLIVHSFQGIWNSLTAIATTAHHPVLAFFFSSMQAVFAAGAYGVSIFFVVSGFCIHLSYRRSRDAGWAVFFTRRIFRIYPAYLVSLVFLILILPLTRWSWSAFSAAPVAYGTDLVLHLGLFHNLLPQTFTTIDIPYWSLAIEFQLYLLFPFLLVMTRKIGWQQTLIVTAIVEAITRLALVWASVHVQQHLFPVTWFGWNKLSPFGFWFSWALGAALAEAFVEKKPLPFANGPLPLWTWPLLVLLVDQIPILKNFAFPVAAFGTARFLSSLLAKEEVTPAAPGLTLRALNFMGITSYSVYLLHHPLYHYLIEFVPLTHGQASGFVFKLLCVFPAMAAVLFVSYLLFRFVETPGINLGKSVVRGLRQRKQKLLDAAVDPA